MYCRADMVDSYFSFGGQRPSRTDEAIDLMAKFTVGHQKVAEEMHSAMSADERVVCAENLQVLVVNPKRMPFDEDFVQKINAELDAGSIESLRSQNPIQSKRVPGVSIQHEFPLDRIALNSIEIDFHS